jgi:DNA-3-methyladenine glycosylase
MKLKKDFYTRDALKIAPEILGKFLVRRFDDGRIERRKITEVEVYGGEEDLASHARFGKTKRNSVMYGPGGRLYVYLIYGMYYLGNIITGKDNDPQAVLIRGVEGLNGPGKVGKWLQLDKSFYGEDLTKSKRIWIETAQDGKGRTIIDKTERIGVDYAGVWAKKKWRFVLKATSD